MTEWGHLMAGGSLKKGLFAASSSLPKQLGLELVWASIAPAKLLPFQLLSSQPNPAAKGCRSHISLLAIHPCLPGLLLLCPTL